MFLYPLSMFYEMIGFFFKIIPMIDVQMNHIKTAMLITLVNYSISCIVTIFWLRSWLCCRWTRAFEMVATISSEGALKFSLFLKDNAVIHENNIHSVNDSVDVKTIIAMFFPDLVSLLSISFFYKFIEKFVKNSKASSR